MSSDTPSDSELAFDGLDSDESPRGEVPRGEAPHEEATRDEADTPSPYQQEVAQLVDGRLATMQKEHAAQQRRMEYLKFGVLAAILLITVLIIAVAQPLIFNRIVPAVMNGDGSVAIPDDNNPVNQTDGSGTAVPDDNTQQNLPIISVPGSDGSDGTGTGGEGQEEATAVPAQIYVVQTGDTLNSIARQFNTTVEAIVAANDIQNPDALLVGTTLIIPHP